MVKLILTLIAVVALATVVTPAGAFVLGLDWGVMDQNTHYDIYVQSLGGWFNNPVLAGSFNGYLGGSLGGPLPPNDGTYFGKLYCVDLSHWIEIPTEYEVSSDPLGNLQNGQRAAWLVNNKLASVGNNTDKSAGLQLAIWNAVYDNDFTLGAGSFKATGGHSTARAYASNFLAEMQNQGPITGETATYLNATGNYGQDLITPVPEPASLTLLGLGLGAAGLVSKRKKARG
jgi:hypothetical protein